MQVLAAEFSSKYSSKREVYQFLAGQVKAYLASFDSVSIYFLRDLVIGKKKFIKSEEIIHLFVPFYQGLSIEQMMKKAATFPNVADYMPDGQDLQRSKLIII